MSGSARSNVRSARGASPASSTVTSAPREPFLSQDSGAGTLVKFNALWAVFCTRQPVFAAFVCLFDENVMPRVRPVVVHQDDLGEMPAELQAALFAHASKKFIDATAALMDLTEKLYNMYWMSLSIEWQQRLAALDGYAAIKANFDLLGLKTMLESAFNNPTTGGAVTRDAIDKAMSAYQTCSQFDRESMAAYVLQTEKVGTEKDFPDI